MNSGFSWRITIGKVSPWLLALILGGYIASDRILDISIPITIAGNGNDGGSKNLSPALLKVREEFLKIQNEDDRMLIYKLDGPESRRWFHSIFENLVTAIGNV